MGSQRERNVIFVSVFLIIVGPIIVNRDVAVTTVLTRLDLVCFSLGQLMLTVEVKCVSLICLIIRILCCLINGLCSHEFSGGQFHLD